MTDEIPQIIKNTREPLLIELKMKSTVYNNVLVNEKDYYLKLRLLLSILRSPRMQDQYRKAYQRVKT